MSSEPLQSRPTSNLLFTEANAADSERFLADASARLAQSLDVLATVRTLSELAVESFADGCRITMLDEAAQSRGDYPFVHVALSSRSPEHEALAREIQDRYPLAPDAPAGFPYGGGGSARTGEVTGTFCGTRQRTFPQRGVKRE